MIAPKSLWIRRKMVNKRRRLNMSDIMSSQLSYSPKQSEQFPFLYCVVVLKYNCRKMNFSEFNFLKMVNTWICIIIFSFTKIWDDHF